MNSGESRIPTEGSVRDFVKERCCHCPGAVDSSQVSSSTETVCTACQRLHSSPLEFEKDCKCLDPRSRRRNFCGSRTDIEGEKGHRCRSGVNEGRCLRCVSSVVRWSSAKRTVQRLVWLIVPLLLLTFVSPSIAQVLESTSSHSTARNVCQSIDIRNKVSELTKLENCTVVEGFVNIVLMYSTNDSSFANITFPKLVEITDYLVLYRVNGLRSIGHLFPNLAVIRGNSLFVNYALVAFEMMHLQEIGLHSLTDILRGSVRFEKNPALCYADTIDWDIIAKSGKGEHVILGNNAKNGCPICDKDCPAKETNRFEHLCWNKEHCQKVCPNCGDGTCMPDGQCCHRSCLGGCTGPTTSDCKACKNVMLGTTCVDSCPQNTFSFMDRRCMTEQECRSQRRPREPNSNKEYTYKPFQNVCRSDCPVGYMDDESSSLTTCKKCNGPCQKECAGANIDSIASAQRLRGCTHITGSLEIQIRGGKNIVKEMEDSLSMIEEINGYLKVVRSFPVISLNFLKNLKIIRGNESDNEKSLVVLDNQNLQELWDWTTKKSIKILYKNSAPGKVFFHFNPKLCLQKIEKLREVAKLEPFTDLEVAPNNNGDKNACNVTLLYVRIAKKASNVVVITWAPFEHHDLRTLLGYVVYFIEAPFQSVTMYDGRDACGGDEWKVDDFSPPSETSGYTQYAFYIKTYTIATERSGAQSEITYFTTLPGAPSIPQKLSTYSNDSDVLIITWHSPAEKNGNFTVYRIVGRYEPDDPTFLEQRNYCDEPISAPETRPAKEKLIEEENKEVEAEKNLISKPETDTCDCSGTQLDPGTREKGASNSIAFEDALHNQVYIKGTNNRRRREIDESFSDINRHRKRDISTGILGFRILTIIAIVSLFWKNAEAMSTNKDNTSLPSPEVKLEWEEPPKPSSLIVAYQIEYRNMDIQNIKPTTICVTRTDFIKGKSYTLKDLPAGNYTVKVRAVSLAGYGNYTQEKIVSINEYNTMGKFWIIYFIVTLFVIIFLIVTLFVVMGLSRCSVCKRKFMRNDPSMRLIATVNPEYVSTAYIPDEWEVPRKKINLLRELSNGCFGMVYEGIAKDVVKGKPEVPCAVKTVNENATDRDRIEFLNEASVMKAFNTHHVVRLLGVVSRGQPTLVVMELMANGDLKSYLRSHRPDVCDNFSRQPPSLKRILQMATEIADGMAYLSAKRFVHRDLAARNCMVAEDLTVKIGDFGMTRDIYETDYYRKETKGLLPVRWMAPESLKDGVFTSFSDVWSYGVVLWEMVTLASQPYQGLSNDQTLRYVIDGGVMERPENCPDPLYDMMRGTWNHKATKRPTFIDIATILLREVDVESFQRVSFYHSTEGIDARNLNAAHNLQNDKDLEMATLQDLREEEAEGEEDSPLRQDFGDFADFEPLSLKKNSTPRYDLDSYSDGSKTSNFHDINSSKIPLKAGFDDFDGISVESLASSKDTLNLPFAEDSVKSVKNSPFSQKKSSSRGNVSQTSMAKSVSPQNSAKQSFLDSPSPSKTPRVDSDYENRSPEILPLNKKMEKDPIRMNFVSLDAIDIESNEDDKGKKRQSDYVNRSETLNNGYIGGATT